MITAKDFKPAVQDQRNDTFVEIFSYTCRACNALAPRVHSLALLMPEMPTSPAGIKPDLVQMDIDHEDGLPAPVYGVSVHTVPRALQPLPRWRCLASAESHPSPPLLPR